MAREYGRWFAKGIKGERLQELGDWLNKWGDFDQHEECLDDLYTIGKSKKPNHITAFGRGYNQAMEDVYEKLQLEFLYYDKRTKTGFRKEK